MKKLLAMLLALMMFMPCLTMAEDLDDLGSMESLGDVASLIGGADGPTSLYVASAPRMGSLADAALAAGRRVDTVMTVFANGLPIGDAAIEAAMSDLLDALALRFSQQGDEGEVTLSLSDKDVMNFAGMISGNDCYINSNLLGGTMVVAANEVEPLLGRLLDMLVLMGALSERDVAEIKALIAEAMISMEQNLNSVMEEMVSAMESINFSAFEAPFINLLSKITEVENPVVPRMCDPAVAGVQLTMNDDDMKQLVKGLFQFLLDNPMILDYLSMSGGLNADMVKEALAEVNAQTLLDGEMAIAIYVGEDGNIVYATFGLPRSATDNTVRFGVVYSRQTVAAGVAHVVNITVNGRTATFDALATDGQLTGVLYAVDGEKALDLIVKTKPENSLYADVKLYTDEAMILELMLEGECENTDVREYLAGVLTLTQFERGEAIPMTFSVVSDYAIDGVDFAGVSGVAFEGMGVEFGVQVASQTDDAQASIMDGDVTRPAAMDDTAFQNWFVDVVNGLMGNLAMMVTALPESVLTLLMTSGMF